MRLPSLRRFMGVAALVCAVVVVTHVATCRVLHRTEMSEAPAGSHAPMGNHFPDAVVDAATGAVLAGLLALVALWLLRHPVTEGVGRGPSWTSWIGRSPRHRAAPHRTSPSTLCVFRC